MRALARAAAVLAGVAILSFWLTRALPGDPVAVLGAVPGMTEAGLEALRSAEGLDRPMVEQFAAHLWRLLQGDLGVSVVTGQPVLRELAQRLPASAELALAGFLPALGLAMMLGLAAVRRPGGAMDRAGRLVASVGAALPVFVTGLMLILGLYVGLDLIPEPSGRLDPWLSEPPRVTGMLSLDAALAGDWGALKSALAHLVAPAMAMALFAVAPMLRVFRAGLLAACDGAGVRGARAIGLPQRVVLWRYAVPEAMAALIPVAVMMLGYMLGANVLVETVFSWPGAGRWALEAMASLDHAPVQGMMLVLAAVHVGLSLVAGVLARALDPRLGPGDG